MPRLTATENLHPVFRERFFSLMDAIGALKIPLECYEAFRHPKRQADLYMRGRAGNPGGIVTRARAWESRHQYGLAVDLVFRVNGRWSWGEPEKGMWDTLHAEARKVGLRGLGSEQPHVELHHDLNELRNGHYPPVSSAVNLSGYLDALLSLAEEWGPDARSIGGFLHPGAPPFANPEERPSLEDYA